MSKCHHDNPTGAYLKGVMVVLLAAIVLFFSSCTQRVCLKTDKIKSVGQCITGYKAYYSTCSAITEGGYRLRRGYPMLVGDEECVEYKDE